MQDVPEYVRRAGLSFTDHLDSRLEAKLDTEHCVRLNYEAYFFADLWNRARFLADPWLYSGRVTDPVTRERFLPTEHSPRARHEQVTYFFEDDAAREAFQSDPESYRLPGWKM